MNKGEIPKKLLLAIKTSEPWGGFPLEETPDERLGEFLDWYQNQNKYGRYRIRKTFSELWKKGLVQMTKDEKGGSRLLLTTLGSEEVSKHETDLLSIVPRPNWDGKWRLVLCSGSMEPKQKNVFKNKLAKLGLHELQPNLWVHPHECRNEVRLIAEKLGIIQHIRLAEISYIDNEEQLKNIFGFG